jgi:hypothetical protein
VSDADEFHPADVDTGKGYTFAQAQSTCISQGSQLAKIEDSFTNSYINNPAFGVSAYGISWIGGQCKKGTDGVYRYRWLLDNSVVAYGYTNFPTSQEIKPCDPVAQGCMSVGGTGYDLLWRTGVCTDTMADAVCEKEPINGEAIAHCPF